MTNPLLKISEPVRQKLTIMGEEGAEWLTGSESLVQKISQEWQIAVESSLAGGSEAYVARARTLEGTEVVLKIAMPEIQGNTVFANEITALKLADGRGYARLLRSDFQRRALLLEALGTPLSQLGYIPKTQMDIICRTMKEAWRPVPVDVGLPTGADMADWFLEFITDLWENLDQPCSRPAFDRALSFVQARREAFDPQKAVLVHGDAHNANTLRLLDGTQTSFKLIDPDGIVAEPAYDLGVLMREWLGELAADPLELGRERCAYLHRLTGADTEAIWQWGFIQSVATGLLLVQIGQETEGRQMLTVAEAWSGV